MQASIWNAHYMCRSMQEYVSVRSPAQVLASTIQVDLDESERMPKNLKGQCFSRAQPILVSLVLCLQAT